LELELDGRLRALVMEENLLSSNFSLGCIHVKEPHRCILSVHVPLPPCGLIQPRVLCTGTLCLVDAF
jgi:hypothetical protein